MIVAGAACSSSGVTSSRTGPSEPDKASAWRVEQLATVAAQTSLHEKYVETVKSLNGVLRCGENLRAQLVSDWPIGRVYRDGEPVVITVDYSALGCTEVTAFLYVRCATSCGSIRSLLEPGSRPLIAENGHVVATHGIVFPSTYCDGFSEFCKARDKTGFELCALSLAFDDPWPATEKLDLIRSLTDPQYRSDYDARNPHGGVQFGEPCLGPPTATSSPVPILPSIAPAPTHVQQSRRFPPPTLSCFVESGAVSCYDPYAGNIYCSVGSAIYCQSPRGPFECRPDGVLKNRSGITLYC